MKKLFCVLAAMLLLLTGCDTSMPSQSLSPLTPEPTATATPTPTEAPVSTAPEQLRVACTPGDILNPYSCESELNLRLAGLLYEGLLRLETDYSVTPVLAESVEYEGELSWLVTLREGLTFSDGSPLTARDVVVSANAAAASKNYAALLSGLGTVSEVDELHLRITAPVYNPDLENLLSFPIVQYGSQMSDTPVGTGPYRPVGGSDPARLEVNPFHRPEAEPAYSSVELIPVADRHALLLELTSDNVDLVFSDLLPGDLTPTGIATYLDVNRLCYLGANYHISYTLRSGLSSVIDRQTILRVAYSDAGAVASTPFNPRAKEYADLTTSLPEGNAPLLSYLRRAGYTDTDEEGYLTRRGSRFSLTLLVNSESSERMLVAGELIRQLGEIGVELTLSALPYGKYLSALQAGEYDLYLGEVRLPCDLDLSSMLDPEAGAVYGLEEDSLSAGAWYLYRYTGEYDAEDFLSAFERELPFIPLAYHDTAMVYSRSLPGTLSVSLSDPFVFLFPGEKNTANTQNS